MNKSELISKLKRYTYLQKCLFVLDDLSDKYSGKVFELLKPLLLGLANCKPGSKILVTSRYRTIEPRVALQLPLAKGMPYLLGPLHPNESLDLFQSIAFRELEGECEISRMTDIGLEIFNKCANDLQAITNIASILSSEPTLEKWQFCNNVLLESVENPVESILSVVHLMQEHNSYTRQVLLTFSSLFPLDYKFSKLELEHLWEVQGNLYSAPSVEKFNLFFENSLRRGYFCKYSYRDKGDVKTYYKAQVLMHEVVKNLARDNYRLIDKPTMDVDNHVIQHVSFIVDSSWEAPSWLRHAKQLKTLLFLPCESREFITVPDIDEILADLKALQALDLVTVHFKSCSNSIGELKQLRYLRLGISFNYLPECITNLLCLRTLDLRHTNIKKLPEDFHRLHCLRHLYTGGRLIDLPPQFGKLRELRTLDVFIAGQNNGLDALSRLTHLAGKLHIRHQKGSRKHVLPEDDTWIFQNMTHMMLEDLSLAWSSFDGEPIVDNEQKNDALELEFLQPPSTLKILSVQGWKGERFPKWVMDRFPAVLYNLVSIHIADCNRCQCLPSFSSLHSLESLKLWGLKALVWIESRDDDGKASSKTTYFPSLKYLMLANLPQLKGWSHVNDDDVGCQQETYEKRHQYLPLQIFNCLSELRISGCPKLMSMPQVPSLETLEAINIHETLLKHLLHAQESPASSSASSVSSTLKELHITTVHELESLSINLSSLQVLTIRECRDLSNVLMASPNSLKRLNLRACCRLEDIPSAMHNLSVLKGLKIENCEELDFEGRGYDSGRDGWQGLKSIRSLTLTTMSKPEPLPQGLMYLTTLKELSLCWLYNLHALPVSIGYLTQLTRLVIQCCPRLNSIPEYFPNLKSLIQLEIKGCPKLERRCKQPNGDDCKLIEHISVVSISW